MYVYLTKQTLIKHWSQYAEEVLKWLKGRPITIEQIFSPTTRVFRRYFPSKSNKKELVYIKDEQDVLYWAKLHTYSFHPYICAPEQTAPCWYVLDIDPEPAVDFELTKRFTKIAVEYLKKEFANKDLDLNYCGNRGFHIIVWLQKFQSQEKLFELSRKVSLNIAKEAIKDTVLAKNLQITLTSKQEAQEFEEFKKNAGIKDKNNPLLKLDTRILHKFANIRSPWSIHPETGHVAMVVEPADLEDFTLDKVIKYADESPTKS